MTADKELKAFIDRILRLKEEQDALSQDIRDVYGEAKGRGYDKTVMGKVVAYLRKVEKSCSQGIEEQESIFEIYLSSYQGTSGTAFATHTHEEKFYPATGEILDREARSRRRMSESMDDHKAMSSELAAAGLISEEAASETASLADAVARKFGNGPLSTTQPASVGAPPAAFNPMAALGTEESAATNSPETVIAGPKVLDGRSGDGPESRHHTVVSEDEAGQNLTSNIIQAQKPLRPHCRHPGEEACGGYGDRHCGECLRLHVSSKSEVAA